MGAYERASDQAIYAVDIFDWGGVKVGRVSATGWQLGENLLCRLRARDENHLELVFERHGMTNMPAVDYTPGDVIVTLVRVRGTVKIEWGALSGPAEDSAPASPPPSLSELMQQRNPSARSFASISTMSARVSSLLGDDRADFDERLDVGSSPTQQGDLLLFSASAAHRGGDVAGIAYDTKRDRLVITMARLGCRDRFDVWIEGTAPLSRPVRDWINELNSTAAPVTEHRGR